MRIGGKVIVSDAGEFELDNLKAALKSVGATKRIDVAILGHPHDDHVKNFAALFAAFEVKKAVLSRSDHWQGTKTNRAAIAAITAEGLTPTYVTAGQTYTWGGGTWEILNPPAGKYDGGAKQAANASVAYLLRVNAIDALFTGDVEKKVATEIAARLAPHLSEPVDIFLATHHGSKHGSITELLNVAKPRFAVLSTGPNSHKHPAPEAITRLKASGATIWCTDTNGTIDARISANGKLTWKARGQSAVPWWSAKTKKKTGSCVGR
jgi:competence protein ComEC